MYRPRIPSPFPQRPPRGWTLREALCGRFLDARQRFGEHVREQIRVKPGNGGDDDDVSYGRISKVLVCEFYEGCVRQAETLRDLRTIALDEVFEHLQDGGYRRRWDEKVKGALRTALSEINQEVRSESVALRTNGQLTVRLPAETPLDVPADTLGDEALMPRSGPRKGPAATGAVIRAAEGHASVIAGLREIARIAARIEAELVGRKA